MIRARPTAVRRGAGADTWAPLLGIADRAVQAATGLAVMGAFLVAARPEDFGRYALVLSLALLPQGLNASSVALPMRTLLPRQAPPAREALAGGFRRLSWLLAAGAALVVAAAVLAATGGDPALAAAGAAFALASIVRERSRAEWDAHRLASRGLRQTTFCAAAAVVAVGALVGAGSLEARSALLALAAASLMAAALCGRTALAGPTAPLRATWMRARPFVSWTVLGAVLVWGQTNLYALATYLAADADALGRVAMARATLLPLTLAAAGLGMALRPQLAALVAAGDGDGLLAVRRRAFGAVLAGVAAYGLVAGGLLGGLGGRLLPEAYAGTDAFARLWLVDGLLVAGAGVATPFLIATLQFRTLALWNALSVAVGVVAVVRLAPAYGAAGALAAQLAADAVLCAAVVLASGRVLRAASPIPVADGA